VKSGGVFGPCQRLHVPLTEEPSTMNHLSSGMPKYRPTCARTAVLYGRKFIFSGVQGLGFRV